MLRHISVANSELISGKWRQHIGGQLSGRTVGIIGCGHIGKDLVKLLIPFDCSILVNDIRNYADFYSRYDLKPVSLDDLLSKSDLITLHVPLDDSTKNIIGSKELSLMKPTAFLINTARGNLVDEVALKMALIENRIAGAAFDVFGTEPPQDIELLKLANFLATPHIGGSAEEAILAMGRAAIEGLDSYINPEEL
jgi:D-3-phosphoglycerate dehydrogenase